MLWNTNLLTILVLKEYLSKSGSLRKLIEEINHGFSWRLPTQVWAVSSNHHFWLASIFKTYHKLCVPSAGLAESYPKALGGSVAVLTPYKAQLGLLKTMATSRLPKASLAHIDFATIDGFQVQWRFAEREKWRGKLCMGQSPGVPGVTYLTKVLAKRRDTLLANRVSCSQDFQYIHS